MDRNIFLMIPLESVILQRMEFKLEKLKHSRAKFYIKAVPADLAHAAEHAYEHLAPHVTVKGFRAGKAPRNMIVQSVGKGRLLSELVDHALPELLLQAADEKKITIIESPAYAIEKLCELEDDGALKADTVLQFTAEADIAPEVEVGDYKKLKVKSVKSEEATDETVDDVLRTIRDQRGKFEVVDRPAQANDRVDIDFTGKRNGIPEDRLASKNYPVVIGSNAMIPGFEDQIVGKKAGDTFSFEITFPKDYHAKDLANEKVVFDIKVHEVAEKQLPEVDASFAKEFGHDTVEALREAIRQDREYTFAQKAKEDNEAAVLEAFLPLVKVDMPQSLIERELDRQVDTMRKQVEAYGLKFDNYLEHLKKTEEGLRDELRPVAEKAVKIGLGLGVVAAREGLDKDKNTGYEAIARLVEIATGAADEKPKKA